MMQRCVLLLMVMMYISVSLLSQLVALDKRMEELREELKRCEKRRAKLEAAPPATMYLTELASLDSLPPEFPVRTDIPLIRTRLSVPSLLPY